MVVLTVVVVLIVDVLVVVVFVFVPREVASVVLATRDCHFVGRPCHSRFVVVDVCRPILLFYNMERHKRQRMVQMIVIL